MTKDIDPRILELYDEYCHSAMERREFLRRAAAITVVGGVSGCAMGQSMLPDYEKTAQVSFNDPRITPRYVTYDSPGGNGDQMKGYLVEPVGDGPFPAVLVVHENRGLNPYVKDVARRLALDGFLAFAPDALSPIGGYPGNDDEGKAMQSRLDRDKILVDMTNGARFVKANAKSNGKLGVTGFCFGGGTSNFLAVELGDELAAAAPFYGSAPDLDRVSRIRARMLLHYAEDDPRVNATREPYEAALTAAGVEHASHTYPGTQHGFHNDSTPRFAPEAAALAWKRTVDLFRTALA